MNAPEKKEEVQKDDISVTPPSTSGATANDNTATATADAVKPELVDTTEKLVTETSAAPAKTYGRSKLRTAFNIAANIGVGAAATFGTKLAVGTLLASFAVPALATLVVSSVAVGAAATLACHVMQNRALKKRGEEKKKLFSKKNAVVFATSGGFALVGGALFLGFEEQIKGFFSNAYTTVSDLVAGKPEPVAAPIVDTAVVPVVPTLEDKVATAVNSANVTSEVKEAFARSASANPVAAAQGTKDLAYYSFNGIGGMPKDQTLAVELFNKAADAGNVQAKVDVAYIQYHGLAGVTADKQAALAAMSELNTAKAEMFTKAWSASGVKAAVVAAPSV